MSAHSLHESTNLWHGLEVDKALEMLDSDANSGLTSQEVEQRRQKYGLNELEEHGGRSPWQILLPCTSCCSTGFLLLFSVDRLGRAAPLRCRRRHARNFCRSFGIETSYS